MFIKQQSKSSIDIYCETLQAVGALSRLASDNNIPYLGYREAENIFCDSFTAKNLARADCSADASKNGFGIGIKTFLNGTGKTLQKVAEFNKLASEFRGKDAEQVVHIVSNLRNERIQFTKRTYAIKDMIYHCIVRDTGKIMIYETPMDEIKISEVKNIATTSGNIITFSDKINEYSFNISKSTLYKRFITDNILIDIPIIILKNPYELIRRLFSGYFSGSLIPVSEKFEEHVVLPLFSDKGGRNVPEKSGLNQWNAAGRPRDPDEIYIPIPAWIHRNFPDFFPNRDMPFDLLLPDSNTMQAKVCQDGGKALMSNPNAALGKWMLRSVLNLKQRELLTYERLKVLGIDSVIIYKESDSRYHIDFKELGTYDDFVIEHNF